jgi:hypothetical protein
MWFDLRSNSDMWYDIGSCRYSIVGLYVRSRRHKDVKDILICDSKISLFFNACYCVSFVNEEVLGPDDENMTWYVIQFSVELRYAIWKSVYSWHVPGFEPLHRSDSAHHLPPLEDRTDSLFGLCGLMTTQCIRNPSKWMHYLRLSDGICDMKYLACSKKFDRSRVRCFPQARFSPSFPM